MIDKKVIHIGTIEQGGKLADIYCKICFKDGKLSISGVIGPKQNGNAIGGCGQIDMEFAHRNKNHNDKRYEEKELIHSWQINFAPQWNADKWLDFLEIWHLYHLNDMHSGCEHQEKLGWENDGYDKHPSEPCPVCGYKFGTAWNGRKVPDEVIKFLESLPGTDKQPAWI